MTPTASTRVSREELLERPAALWMHDVWSLDTEPPGALAALAMSIQLRAAGLPRDALELVVVAWVNALDGLAANASLPDDRAIALDRALALQTHDLPALAAWTAPLRARCRCAADLDHVIQFLLRALTTWRLTEAVAQANVRLADGA